MGCSESNLFGNDNDYDPLSEKGTIYHHADYDKLKSKLNTGDIMLFSSSGTFPDMVKRATQSQWSHVGMVVRTTELQQYGIDKKNDLFLCYHPKHFPYVK